MTADAELIAGYATPEGTARFRDRFRHLLPGHFRRTGGLWLCSIGLGTYLGHPTAYFEQKFVETGIVRPDEVAAGCHVMSPGYLENQVETSRTNLGLATIDLYYVHNPEAQFSQVSRPDFYRRLKAAFAQLEKAVTDGHIRAYGTATWNAYRAGPQA